MFLSHICEIDNSVSEHPGVPSGFCPGYWSTVNIKNEFLFRNDDKIRPPPSFSILPTGFSDMSKGKVKYLY